MITNKNLIINNLVIKVKQGNKEAGNELIVLFNPLIYKISSRIHYRYGQIFPTEEIIRQARLALVYLTYEKYTPDGKAKYNYFIKQHLHAYLINIYRPIWS